MWILKKKKGEKTIWKSGKIEEKRGRILKSWKEGNNFLGNRKDENVSKMRRKKEWKKKVLEKKERKKERKKDLDIVKEYNKI